MLQLIFLRAREGVVTVRAFLAAALSAVGVLAVGVPAAAAASPTTVSFSTPGASVFTVPAGVTSLSITAVGAPGGQWCAMGNPGRGASIAGTFPASPGEQLTVNVGGPGGATCSATSPGGVGGGGSADTFAGAGGGASGVSTGTSTPTAATELIVGGGGGGVSTGGGPGGDAGAAGSTDNGLSTAAQPGSAAAGGAGGTDFSGFNANGRAGAFAVGGAGGPGAASGAGGGGGGGGFYGGGGGAGGLPPAGGGAGGSSYVAPGASNPSGPTVTSSPPSVTITYSVIAPTVTVSTNSLSFGSQPTGALGPEQSFTVTNGGPIALNVAGLQPGGTDPGDYLIIDGCVASVAPGASCQIGVRFAPQAQGASSATLSLISNATTTPTISVAGTGTAPISGPAGPQGPAGAQGPPGPRGPAGTIVCQNTLLARVLCSLEFVPGSYTVGSGATTAAFRIEHHGRTLVSGVLPLVRHSPLRKALGRLRPGHYTLIVTTGHGHRTTVLLRLAFNVR